MTTNYQILTDSSCDLPASLARTLGVSYAPLRVQFQGAEYENFLDGDPRSRLEMKAFYKTLRTGAPTSTTAVNPEGWSTLMAPILAAGQDLLILAFSSGLSSTYAAAVLAAGGCCRCRFMLVFPSFPVMADAASCGLAGIVFPASFAPVGRFVRQRRFAGGRLCGNGI